MLSQSSAGYSVGYAIETNDGKVYMYDETIDKFLEFTLSEFDNLFTYDSAPFVDMSHSNDFQKKNIVIYATIYMSTRSSDSRTNSASCSSTMPLIDSDINPRNGTEMYYFEESSSTGVFNNTAVGQCGGYPGLRYGNSALATASFNLSTIANFPYDAGTYQAQTSHFENDYAPDGDSAYCCGNGRILSHTYIRYAQAFQAGTANNRMLLAINDNNSKYSIRYLNSNGSLEQIASSEAPSLYDAIFARRVFAFDEGTYMYYESRSSHSYTEGLYLFRDGVSTLIGENGSGPKNKFTNVNLKN